MKTQQHQPGLASAPPDGATARVVLHPDQKPNAAVSERANRRAAASAAQLPVFELGDADRAVREGRLRRVTFDSLDQFLAALWSGELDAGAWLAADVEIGFDQPPALNNPPDRSPAPGAPVGESVALDSPTLCRALLASWSIANRRSRRRRAIAGLVLSAIAVAAAFVLVWAAAK